MNNQIQQAFANINIKPSFKEVKEAVSITKTPGQIAQQKRMNRVRKTIGTYVNHGHNEYRRGNGTGK